MKKKVISLLNVEKKRMVIFVVGLVFLALILIFLFQKGPVEKADYDISTTTQSEALIKGTQETLKSFTLDGIVTHQVTFKEVTDDSVILVFQSDPVEITLTIGESKDVDLDADGTTDILVTLNSITNGEAEITATNLSPIGEIPKMKELLKTNRNLILMVLAILVFVAVLSFFILKFIEKKKIKKSK